MGDRSSPLLDRIRSRRGYRMMTVCVRALTAAARDVRGGRARHHAHVLMWMLLLLLLLLLLPDSSRAQDYPTRPLHCPAEEDGVGESVLVDTELGAVNGTRCGQLDHFLGVYYAEPPLGPLRFRPAVPKKKWAPKVMDATFYGPSCYTGGQPPSPNASTGYFAGRPFNMTDDPGDEDCLWIDIFRPAPDLEAADLIPVMVWIHGGGFTQGRGDVNMTNVLAMQSGRNKQILVGIEYRLGPLGFLSSPEIAALAESEGATGGMNGIRDTIVALEWVQKNIRAFGGDPDRVTIMGESSGGLAVCTLVVSPKAKGLFRRAIVQSGACAGAWGPGDLQEGYVMSERIMDRPAANTTNLAELQQLPPWTLGVWNTTAFYEDQLFPGYWIDNWVLSESPSEYFARGEVNVEALIIGANSKDGTVQMYYDWMDVIPSWNATEREYKAALRRQYGERFHNIYEQYPLERFHGNAASAFLQTNSDERLFCPSKRIADLVSRAPGRNSTAYLYYFTRGPRPGDWLSNEQGWDFLPPQCPPHCPAGSDQFASHGNDVWFTWNDTGIGDLNALPVNYSALPECCFVPPANLTACCAATSIHPAACSYAAQCQTPNDTFPLLFTPEEKMLVHDMTNFWASFAANDAPQPSGGRKAWPVYMYRDDDATGAKSNTMQLDTDLQVLRGFKDDDCEFWEREQRRRHLRRGRRNM